MDRSEKIGLGVALVGHVVLFGLLSVGFLDAPEPPKIQQQPIDVSLVPDVALEATAPQSTEAPAQSIAPDEGGPRMLRRRRQKRPSPSRSPIRSRLRRSRSPRHPSLHPSRSRPRNPRRNRSPNPSLRHRSPLRSRRRSPSLS
ncbi:hypothetical protein [Sphingomonas aurantiaca]|uniref:hypothetical protein n=1 Tax=Sphingomonas aurantiaca TaxID=185949 RepID=UPI002FE0969C